MNLMQFFRDGRDRPLATTKANYAASSMQKWPSCRAFVRAFGRPSPEVHEWLMAWPNGWSATSPLARDRFQSWLQQHGACSKPTDSAGDSR